jgi:hypothetical protein
MGLTFPPIVIWRPKDAYYGVGQLEASLTFRNLSGTFDLSHYHEVKCQLEEKIAAVKKDVEKLESYKKSLANGAESRDEETIQKIKAASVKQDEIRRNAKLTLLGRNLKLLENVSVITNLHPCIIDYAINVGLKETSDQWVAFLNTNGSLSEDVILATDLPSVHSIMLNQDRS